MLIFQSGSASICHVGQDVGAIQVFISSRFSERASLGCSEMPLTVIVLIPTLWFLTTCTPAKGSYAYLQPGYLCFQG